MDLMDLMALHYGPTRAMHRDMSTTNGITPSIPVPSGATVTLPLAEYEALRAASSAPPRPSSIPAAEPGPQRETRRRADQRKEDIGKIIACLKSAERPLSRKEVQKATGLSENVVKIDLYHMVDTRKVRRLGGKKNSTYRMSR